jgi:hypothetical protein
VAVPREKARRGRSPAGSLQLCGLALAKPKLAHDQASESWLEVELPADLE